MWVNHNGIWKQPKKVWINDNGVWKQTTPWVNKDGVWKQTSVSHYIQATGGSIIDKEINGTLYRIHAFTVTGEDTFEVQDAGTDALIDVLIVAGGGGGAASAGGSAGGGGGGAGGLIFEEKK